MTEVESAISKLPAPEVKELAARQQAKLWDAQIADDLETGLLDALLADIDREYNKRR